MRPADIEMLGLVLDPANAVIIGIDFILRVFLQRIVRPRALPNLVQTSQVVICNLVTLVMLHVLYANSVSRRLFERGDYIPAKASFCQMV
jgi:hypothetical protein